ncbi:MAG: ATP-binding protein [Candidatus Pacebacteria bacterium]|nr:ATP-binding protein [Candidatus Paceibacterota bacterium]MDD5445970.1 ATP-binding protein [Candidatus Paceibacterota bacterium]
MSADFKNSDEYKKIFLFHETIADRIISRESGWLEFKESFNWNSKDKYAKSMVAFANNKGGYIVFGIKDKPRNLVGLQSNNFEDVDEAKITSYLNGIFAPEIIFEKFITTVKGKTIGILYTQQAKTKPLVCIKNDGELKEAEIYYRYNARSEKIKYPAMKMMFDAVREEERKSWMEHFEKISKIGPTNVAIMDTIAGEISGKSGTLVIDKKLIPKLKFINQGNFQEKGKPVLRLIGDVKPVSIIAGKSKDGSGIQITDDPNAPAFRIEQESAFKSKYTLDHSDLLKSCKTRYSNFRQGKRFNDIKKNILKVDKKYADQWPANYKKPKLSDPYFYSNECYKVLDKNYNKK